MDADGRQVQQHAHARDRVNADTSETVAAGLLRELDAARSAAERDRATLLAEAERLGAALAMREAELREARSDADAAERLLAASVDSSKTCLASLTEQLATVKAACEVSERREADARYQAESLQGLLDGERLRAEREMESLRAKLEVVVTRCAQGDSAAADLTSPDQCTRALQEYREALEEENQELQRDLREMEELRHHDCDTIRALKGELFAADDYRRQAEEELLSLRRDLTDLCANVEALQESAIAAERALLSSNERCESLEKSLADAEEAKAKVEQDLAVARAVLTDALKQCQASDESLAQSQEASEAAQRKLLAEAEQLRAELDELRAAASLAALGAERGGASSDAADLDPSSDTESAGNDGTACATASTPESRSAATEQPLGDVEASSTEDGVTPLLSAGGTGCLGARVDRVCEAERHVAELEFKLAESEADVQQLRADCENRLATSREAVASLAVEREYWKDLYDELHAKVEPFQEQLDAYELERHALHGRSQRSAEELAALSSQYAKLLGHQNQRQKIQHVVKIKEENRLLKKELETLKEEREKLKRAVASREEKIRALEGGRRRLDTPLAFKHDLVAIVTGNSSSAGSSGVLKTPLKDCSNSARAQKP